MKKALSVVSLLFITACSFTHHTVTVGVLTLPARPRADRHFKVRYRIDSSILASKKDLQITLYYTVNNKIYAEPVIPSGKGNRVKARLILPDSAQAFTLRALKKYYIVDNKNGYISPVYEPSGKPVAGALAGVSLFYNDIGDDEIGSSLLARPADEDTALKLMRMEFKSHPGIKHKWLSTYLGTLLTAEKDSAYREINNALEQLLSSDSVQAGDYATAYHLYLKMNEWDKAESAMTAGAQKFPDGFMAMQLAKSRFYPVRSSPDSMIIHYQHFKRRFPTTDVQSNSARIQDRMLGSIANLYADSGDYQKFMTFISQTSNPLNEAGSCWFMASDLIRLNKEIPFADSLLKRSLELVRQTMDYPEQWKMSYQTNEDWEYKIKRTYAEYANDYASLLHKEGKIKDAIAYQKQAVDYLNGEGLSANEHYIQYLMEEKNYKLAQKELEGFIINGRTTDKMNAYLKPLYIRVNYNGEGYTSYQHRLEEMTEVKLMPELIKESVKAPAPDFKLPDLEGNEVSLASLKGKVVVLDFWATWCPPCKASFPGMQKVADDFKTNSHVVFFFVNTLENTPANPGAEKRYKHVSDFMTNHNYSLHVLLDHPKADDSTQYQVVSDYHVDAIPTKVVIGPDGYIRFRKVGFFNTPTEIKEMSLMIKMADK